MSDETGLSAPAPGVAAAQAEKAALREGLQTRRRRRTDAERARAGLGLADAVRGAAGPSERPLLSAELVALFLSTGPEPPTAPLLQLFAAAGARLIVPVLRGDGDLDWAAYRPGDPVVAGRRGTREPAGAHLPPDALGDAGVVLVPALAVDRRGTRLGRGGGGYDRALLRRAPAALTLAVIFDDELVDALPAAAHDQPVDGALTPNGLHLTPGPAST